MANENEIKVIDRGHAHPLATTQRSGFLSPDEKAFLETIMDVGGVLEVTQEVRDARGSQPDLKSRLLEIEQLAAGDIKFSTLETEFFTARAGQTLIILTGEYRPGFNQLDVYLNGIKQHINYSYTEVDTKRILMSDPLAEGTLVEVKYFRDVPAVTADIATKVMENSNELMQARTTSLNVSYTSLKERLDAMDIQGGEATYDSFTTNGTQTDFILSNGAFSVDTHNEEVYLDGLTLEPDVGYQVLSSTTVKILKPTVNNGKLVVKTQKTLPPIISPPDFERAYYSFTISTAGTRTITLPRTYKMGMQRLDVYKNGAYVPITSGYLESSNTSVYFTSPLAAGDIVHIVVYSEGVVLNNDITKELGTVQDEIEEARYNASNVASPTLKARLLSLESTITTNYTTAINTAKSTLTTNYTSAISSANTSLNSTITTNYTAAINTAKTDITTAYTTAINTVDTKVTGLTTRVTTAEGKITTAEGKITTAEGKITTLEKFLVPTVATLPDPVAALRYQMRVVVEDDEDVVYFCAKVGSTYVWKPVTLT